MHVKDGFLLKEINGAYIAIPYDSNYDAYGAMVSLNHTGAYLWHCMEEDVSEAELVSALKEEYGIQDDMAIQAVSSFLTMLREHELLED